MAYIVSKSKEIRRHLDYIRQGYIQTKVSKFILPEEVFKSFITFEPEECEFSMENGWEAPFLNPSIESGMTEKLDGVPLLVLKNLSIFEVYSALSTPKICPDSLSKIKFFGEFFIQNALPIDTWYEASLTFSPTAPTTDLEADPIDQMERIARCFVQCVEIYIESFRSSKRFSDSPLRYSEFTLTLLTTVALVDALFVADKHLEALQNWSPSLFREDRFLKRLQGLTFDRVEWTKLADAVTEYFLQAVQTRPRQILSIFNRSERDPIERDTVELAAAYARSRPTDHIYFDLLRSERAQVAEELQVSELLLNDLIEYNDASEFFFLVSRYTISIYKNIFLH